MEEVVETTLAQHRFSMWLFTALIGLAFLLASVASTAFSRTAFAAACVRSVSASRSEPQSERTALLGVALGGFGAYALSKVLSKLIYGVSATDPLTFHRCWVILLAVALIPCAIPGYGATGVQPLEGLRAE